MWKHSPIHQKISIPLVVLIWIVGTLQIACVNKQSAPAQASNQQPIAPPSHAGAIAPASPGKPWECPAFGSLPEPSAFQTKGEHTVILSWTASDPADAKHAGAGGYCVYRGTERIDRSLARLNSVPFQGTSCTDDTVQTGKTYYYKVNAISTQKKTSDATDFVRAQILDRKPTTHPGVMPPVCRGPDPIH
jgi:hypothetical protein